jgi:hypothetical protein
MGSSVTGTVWRPGEGLSTGRNVKPGESALESDSGVPTELKDPGSGLDVVSNLITIKNYVHNRMKCQSGQYQQKGWHYLSLSSF